MQLEKTDEGIPMSPSTMPNGLNGANGTYEEFSFPEATPEGPYRVLDQYHSKPRKMRIACVGAGASGLCLAYKLEKMLVPGTWELTLFEKNPQFGGTWYENTYPGVACDIPSHDYNFTWDPKWDWSQFFASGAEIQKYFEDFATRHGSHKYMKLNTKVVEGRYDEEAAVWNITTENQTDKTQSKDWAHIFINGTGILNSWAWPDIEGLHDFKGSLMHSAAWDHTVDFNNKTVAVIGNGSTAVQIIPQLQKITKRLKTFMRSPTWISPPFGAGALQTDLIKGAEVNPGQRQYTFSEEEKEKFRNSPEYHLDFRKRIEAEINSLFGMYKQGSELSNQFRQVITDEMRRRMGPGNEELKKRIIPTWSPGCRRISPGDGFLEALVKDNVDVIYEGIERVTPDGIVTKDGTEHKIDALVCATGFKVAFRPAFKVINGAGKSIDEDWVNGPNLYLGCMAPRFPGYFVVVGPGATWSNGTLIPSIETTIEFTIQVIKKMQTELIRSVEVKQEALDDIYGHFDEFHKATVWKEECRSWFKDGKVKNRIYLWPGAVSHAQPWKLLCAKLLPDNPFPQIHQDPPMGRLQLQVHLQEPVRLPGQR
jgi:cation diffusion facilitator CzcD-associated flavoprotein CzcO